MRPSVTRAVANAVLKNDKTSKNVKASQESDNFNLALAEKERAETAKDAEKIVATRQSTQE